MFKSLLSLLLFIHCASLGFAQSQWRTEKKWAFRTGDWGASSPSIGTDGTIYVGSRDGYLYAINPDGSKKWAFKTGGDVDSSPAIGSDGTIYVGSWDKNLYAINPDGSQKWAFKTGKRVSSPAIGSDGTIYVGSYDKNLYAINPNGSKKWAFKTGDGVDSSPAIGSDGTIYVGSSDFYLYAINPDGSQKWAFKTVYIVNSSPAIGTDGTIYVGSWDKNLYAINPDGSKKWAFKTGNWVESSPAIGSDGTIYVGSRNKELYAINPDGSKKWAFRTGDRVESSPAIGNDGTIYVGSWDGYLYAISDFGINIFDQSISKGQSLTLQYFPQPSFTYQWFYNAKEIPGATSISYTIENADLEDSGTYVLAIMDRTGKVRLYKPAVITVTPNSVEEKDKDDQLKIEISKNGERLLTFNPQDGKANWQIDFSGDLQDWKNLGKLDTNKTITDSRDSAEILLEQHTAKHGGFGIRTWSAEKGNLKSFDETKGQYEFLSPAEFAERFGLDYPIKQFYRARLVD